MKKILIIGANSSIAQAIIRELAKEPSSFFLVGRNPEKLQNLEQDLKVRGVTHLKSLVSDLSILPQHDDILSQALSFLGSLDIVLLAHGQLSDQALAEKNVGYALEQMNINFLSYVSLLTLLANIFEEQKKGSIAVISSVAGDRGRPSNYLYGTAKGALSLFLQGLRARLAKYNVSVLTIKPGMIETPMTAHLPSGPLFVSPKTVAKDVVSALKKKREIIYTPSYWRYIMTIICSIPERYFKQLSL